MKKKLFVIMFIVFFTFSCAHAKGNRDKKIKTQKSNVLKLIFGDLQPNVKAFFLDVEVTSHASLVFDSPASCEDMKKEYEKESELARKLFSINGVGTVSFPLRYMIVIRKGLVFDWEKINEKIYEMLRQHYKKDSIETINVKQKPSSLNSI